MDTGNEIALVIRIMDKDHIRLTFCKIIVLIPGHRHIVWIVIPFIVHFPKTSVWILIIIWNRNHISVTIWVLVCRFPHTL